VSEAIAYLNGEFMPLGRAKISVLDRGFLFGDGVYEVIPAYGGRLFRLDQHLQRLDHSLRAIRLDPPLTHSQWRTVLRELLQGDGDQSVYLQVTRGVAPRRDHTFPSRPRPTVVAWATPMDAGPPRPARVLTHEDIRWQWCHIKAITLLANVLLRQEALERDCHEVILIRDGKVTEGAASNVFAVIDGVLVTPPKSRHLLPGITRDFVLELARAENLPFQERDLYAGELAHAGEIWLTSSTRELVPVIELDGKPVGDGRPGPLWQRLYRRFQDYKQAFRRER